MGGHEGMSLYLFGDYDLYWIYLTVDHTRPKPSPQNTIRHNKASLYPAHQQGFPVDLEFTGMALRPHCVGKVDVEVAEVLCQYLSMTCSTNKPFKMNDLFKDVYEEVPKDVLCKVIMAQYAECEVTHYQVLSSTWELKRHERWKCFHSHCLNHFHEQNEDCQQRLELWCKWCIDMGMEMDSLEQDVMWHMLHEQTLALNDMQDHYKHIEKIGIARV